LIIATIAILCILASRNDEIIRRVAFHQRSLLEEANITNSGVKWDNPFKVRPSHATPGPPHSDHPTRPIPISRRGCATLHAPRATRHAPRAALHMRR
jgi:hypothetical protein